MLHTIIITSKTESSLIVWWILSNRGRNSLKYRILMASVEVFHVNVGGWKSSYARGKKGATTCCSNLNSVGDKNSDNGRKCPLLGFCECKHKGGNK